MDAFIRGVLATPTLDATRERQLAQRARCGETAARDELVTECLRQVALQALLLGARGEQLSDAFQSGVVGLISAVDRFDPERGARLATYAWPWIRGAILAELTSKRTPVEAGAEKAPADQSWELLEGLQPLHADVLRLRFGLGRDEGGQARRQVAEQLELSVHRVRQVEAEAMRQLRGRLGSIDPRALT